MYMYIFVVWSPSMTCFYSALLIYNMFNRVINFDLLRCVSLHYALVRLCFVGVSKHLFAGLVFLVQLFLAVA